MIDPDSRENIGLPGSEGDENSTENQGTGLPGLRSWSRVYTVVVVVFIIWVSFLVTLKNLFS